MNFWKSLFNKKQDKRETRVPDETREIKNGNKPPSSIPSQEKIPEKQSRKQRENEHVQKGNPSSQINSDKRSIHVFVSSTFRDLMEEREELVKVTFPELRKRCKERQVEFNDVDLRWGITDEQKAEGKVLPICLAEIERCRPYFIGILGEHYGWVPEKINLALTYKQQWLKEHKEKSVTELEIIHGVLQNPTLKKSAYFYFRDLKKSTEVEEELKRRSDYVPEPEVSRNKLNSLKQKIEESGYPIHKNFPDAKTFGQRVLEDLWTVIDLRFPKEVVPTPLERERMEHKAFAETRRKVYIGRKEYFQRLDWHVDGDGPPLVVLGESGSGKSALLSNWALKYQEDHPNKYIHLHFIGASTYSSDWVYMLRRIMGEIKLRFGIQQEIPDKPDQLRSAFANWLQIAALKGRIILILDALNQLENHDGAPDLVWLPQVIPSNIRLILSTLPGRSFDELIKRNCPTIKVQPLSIEEREIFISNYLTQFTKGLSSNQIVRISKDEQTTNPLYLKTLIEELRIFGSHEQLDNRISFYLKAKTIPDLYEKILTRYEEDFEKDRKGLVKDTMSYLWASRNGLTESELLEILGENGSQLPKAIWSPLYLAAEQSLVNRSGLINFSHDYLRQAIQNRYLLPEEKQWIVHLGLADYFNDKKLGERKLHELPWQLSKAKAWEKLKILVKDSLFFNTFYRQRQSDALYTWSTLEKNSEHRIIETYNSLLEHPQDFTDDFLEVISNLLNVTGHWEELLSFHKSLTKYYSQINDTYRLSTNLLGQASILVEQGNSDGALGVLSVQDSQIWHVQTLWISQEYLRIMSRLSWRNGKLEQAMGLLNAREELCRNAIGFEKELVGTLVYKSFIAQQLGEYEKAEYLLKESERISLASGDLGGYQATIGEFGLILIEMGDLNGALEKFSKQERICRDQGELVSLAGCLGNIGSVYSLLGQETKALAMFEEMETLSNKCGQMVLYHVSRCNQATELYRTDKGDKALKLINEAVEFFRANKLTEQLADALISQGHILSFRMKLDLADQSYIEGITLFKQMSLSHKVIADAIYKAGSHYLAVFLSGRLQSGKFSEIDNFSQKVEPRSLSNQYLKHAEKHLKNAIQVWPGNFDYYKNLGDVLLHLGDINGAINSFRRTIEIGSKSIKVSVQLADLLLQQKISSEGILEAIELLEKATVAKPESPIIRDKLNHAYAKSGNFHKVVTSVIQTIIDYPEWSQWHYAQLENLLNSGYGIEIHNVINELVKMDVENPLLWYILGMSFQTLEKQEKAVASYSKGLEKEPTNAVLFYNLGNTLNILGDRESCIKFQYQAITHSSTLAEPHFVLGFLYMNAKKSKEAKKHFEIFLQLGKSYLGIYLSKAAFYLSSPDINPSDI